MSKFALANATFLTALLALPNTKFTNTEIAYDAASVKVKASVSCTPDRASIARILTEGEEINLLPGSGSYVWKIKTASDSAQMYFNQGINMYYGFHIIEAIASFKKAAKFDETNPMIRWAEALAYGPNINDVGYTASPEALTATNKAVELSAAANETEKALIDAMKVRYSNDTTKTRAGLNQDYVDAMKKVADQFPGNVDVLALYADAMMLQHPWDLWLPDGTPKPWQPAIQAVLEKVIKADSMHPGANHYYIHVVEASPFPEKALHSADVLGKITPGLSHLVHMPSHIYLRTGEFDRGVTNNLEAVGTYKKYSTLFPPSNGNVFIYYWHNLHMLANCAMLSGRYNEAIKAADELRSQFDSATLALPTPLGSLVHYIYMTPLMVNVRFEKWDEILAMQKPDEKYIYGNVLYHFGRGMALAGKNNFAAAKKEASMVGELMKEESLKIPMSPFSSASDGAQVAYGMLNGFIALKQKDNKKAIENFEKAAKHEWEMVYNEPRDWLLNPYQYLGTAYIADKKYKKAEEAFKKDLTRNAKNVWSLNGLEKARGRGQRAERRRQKADNISQHP